MLLLHWRGMVRYGIKWYGMVSNGMVFAIIFCIKFLENHFFVGIGNKVYVCFFTLNVWYRTYVIILAIATGAPDRAHTRLYAEPRYAWLCASHGHFFHRSKSGGSRTKTTTSSSIHNAIIKA